MKRLQRLQGRQLEILAEVARLRSHSLLDEDAELETDLRFLAALKSEVSDWLSDIDYVESKSRLT